MGLFNKKEPVVEKKVEPISVQDIEAALNNIVADQKKSHDYFTQRINTMETEIIQSFTDIANDMRDFGAALEKLKRESTLKLHSPHPSVDDEELEAPKPKIGYAKQRVSAKKEDVNSFEKEKERRFKK